MTSPLAPTIPLGGFVTAFVSVGAGSRYCTWALAVREIVPGPSGSSKRNVAVLRRSVLFARFGVYEGCDSSVSFTQTVTRTRKT